MIKTNLAQTVDATNDSGSEYDTNIKYLLADKQILSRILKYTVEEFRDMDVQDIMDCIGEDIEIGSRPVDVGLSSIGRVRETVTEDNVPGEGIIYYDIRFTAYHKEKELKILINIEAQKQIEFFHSDFDNLKRVRSIWICMDNDATEDSIEEISFDRKTVFGNKVNSYHADLMKGIIVNIRGRKINLKEGNFSWEQKNVLQTVRRCWVLSLVLPESRRFLLTRQTSPLHRGHTIGRIVWRTVSGPTVWMTSGQGCRTAIRN